MKSFPADTTATARDTFLNAQGLESVKKLGRERNPEALREVARQFESMFVQQMLKSMRAAGDVFAEDNFMNSSESDFYRDMYDQQLSLDMAKGQGIGLAEALYQQLLQSYGQTVDVTSNPNHTAANPASLATSFNPPAAKQTAPVQEDSGATADTFIEKIRPYANWAGAVLNVDPKGIMAQAVLETGWGESVIEDSRGSSHNLFNIKAGSNWSGERVGITTTEYEDGQAESVQADFRRYDSLFTAFSDYVELMKKPRYQSALAAGADAHAYADELQKAGYATDPAYAKKIQSLLSDDRLQKADSLQMAALDSDGLSGGGLR